MRCQARFHTHTHTHASILVPHRDSNGTSLGVSIVSSRCSRLGVSIAPIHGPIRQIRYNCRASKGIAKGLSRQLQIERVLLLLHGSSFALLLLRFLLLIPETTQGTKICFPLLHHQAVHQRAEILLPLLDQLDGSLIANGLEEMLFVGVAYMKR